MRKGEATRQRIVARAANLLNKQGYRGTPVSQIMRVAGLQKGGIYRHFRSRSALTMDAFTYAVARMRARLSGVIEGKPRAMDRLSALFDVARNVLREEAFRGGCPVANLSVESDDADPKLCTAARTAMSQLIGLFEQVITEAMKQGDAPQGDAQAQARFIVASLEGGILLSNLFKDSSHMEAVVKHLSRSLPMASD